MKKLILGTAFIVCALVMAGPSGAAILGLNDLVGTMIDGVPNSIPDEALMSQKLINEYDGTSKSGTYNPSGPLDETWQVYASGLTLPLPAVDETGASKTNLSTFATIPLSGTTYQYLFAHFGGYSALFFIDSSYTEITGLNTSGFEPAGVGGGLSSVTLFNPGTTRVPEAGAMLMFASGLIGLVGYRRMRRMQ